MRPLILSRSALISKSNDHAFECHVLYVCHVYTELKLSGTDATDVLKIRALPMLRLENVLLPVPLG